MIIQCIPIKETENSHIFCSAKKRCQFEEHGYEEKEYLFKGTANIYGQAQDGGYKICFTDCSYTNRFVLRMPAEAEKFSGRVIVEILNSTANFDIDRVWADSYRFFLRNGDAYIGITSKPNVFESLKRFDEERYKELDWPNPFAEPAPDTDIPPLRTGPADQEIGYIWDILKDMPDFIRSKTKINPLHLMDVRYVYLCGWLQSCGYMETYIKNFESEDHAVYSGYFAAGGVHSLGTPLNRYEYGRRAGIGARERRINQCFRPLLEINTESEASNAFGVCGYDAAREDSDDPSFLYRYMDIAGSCHDTKDSCMDYGRFDQDVQKALGSINWPIRKSGLLNNYSKRYAFHVAWHNLYFWAEQGIPPKSYPRMLQSAGGEILRDAFGNALGGMRTPMIEYPLCTYYSQSEEEFPETGEIRINFLSGREEYFSAAFLRELYKDADGYMQKLRKSAKQLCAGGHMLKEDIEEMLALALQQAKDAGL